jgi:hypothetical protein
MIQNTIRKANKKRLSSGKKIDAVYALPDQRGRGQGRKILEFPSKKGFQSK